MMPSSLIVPANLAIVFSEMEADSARPRADTEDKWVQPRSLHKDAAHLLCLLAKIQRAQNILEIGTSVGYSTLYLALAAEETEGHVTTLELLPAKYEAAASNLARAGLNHRVTQHLGDALELLPTLAGPWDLVFLDPEKELYEEAWRLFAGHVRPGGLVVADNLTSHADDLAGYVAMVHQDSRFESLTVPIGLGLEVSYRTHRR